MGKYTQLAETVLHENEIRDSGGKNVTNSEISRCERSEICELSPAQHTRPNVVSVDEFAKKLLANDRTSLKELAENDWQEIHEEPTKLMAFASLEATERIRATGHIPDTYTSTTICSGCGPVPIWEGCPPEVGGCPWCSNRANGLPVPMVTVYE